MDWQCWEVLDGCIARLESPLFVSGEGVDAQVARVIDGMIAAVRCRSP